MADSVVRNANKEDIPIYEEEGSEGDEYLMENQNFDFLEEDPDELLQRMYNNPPKDLNDEMMDRFVTFGGSESEGGLADAPLGGIDLLNTNYVKPKYIPLEYGGSPGIESIMKKTTIMEMPADRSMLVMNRLMKQGGVTETRDPRLMAQLAQVLGRDG